MKFPFPYVYHCHTKRCGHAFGEDEEYVLNAIKSGIKVLCFTDHIPFPGIANPGIRMDYSEIDEYISSINHLKEKYKDQIEIHIGFEAEYIPERKEYLHSLLDEKRVEFLILGQHSFYINNELEFITVYYDDKKKNVENYLSLLLEGLNSGLFNYVAHPDMFINVYREINPYVESVARKIIEAAIKNNVVMEINGQGLNNSKSKPHTYPDVDFWKIVGQYKDAKVTIGIDAHNPEEFLHSKNARKLLKIKKEAGIRLHRKIQPWIYSK